MTKSRLVVQNISGVVVVDFTEASILDTNVIEAIERQLYELVDEQAQRKILLDFSHVRFLSSSLLGVLIGLQKKSRAIRGRIVICGLSADLKKPFEITHLDKLFEFHRDQEAGLKSFGVYMA